MARCARPWPRDGAVGAPLPAWPVARFPSGTGGPSPARAPFREPPGKGYGSGSFRARTCAIRSSCETSRVPGRTWRRTSTTRSRKRIHSASRVERACSRGRASSRPRQSCCRCRTTRRNPPCSLATCAAGRSRSRTSGAPPTRTASSPITPPPCSKSRCSSGTRSSSRCSAAMGIGRGSFSARSTTSTPNSTRTAGSVGSSAKKTAVNVSPASTRPARARTCSASASGSTSASFATKVGWRGCFRRSSLTANGTGVTAPGQTAATGARAGQAA